MPRATDCGGPRRARYTVSAAVRRTPSEARRSPRPAAPIQPAVGD
jgi:hypothetical protein